MAATVHACTHATLIECALSPGTPRTSREARPAGQEGSSGKSPRLLLDLNYSHIL